MAYKLVFSQWAHIPKAQTEIGSPFADDGKLDVTGYNSDYYLSSPPPVSFATEDEGLQWLAKNHKGPDAWGVCAIFQVVTDAEAERLRELAVL